MASLVLSFSPFTSSIHPSLALKPLVCKRVLVRVCMCINPDISSLGKKDNSEDITQLQNFVQLNIGCWNGTFKQFDAAGNMLAAIPTKLKASPYGRGEFTSLYQTLSVKQPKSRTVIAGSDDDVEWFEYQVDEIDIFTIDKKHKLGYFHNEKAYCLSHPTAEMLNVLLRAGLLGEEDDEHQEFFEGVKLPCRRPALVTESCLYSEEGNSRVRAFHVLNAQGLVDTIGIFYEERESEAKKDEKASGLNIGCWNGTFKQFDAAGNMLAAIPTKLKASPYGRGEFTSLYQTLSVKQPKSRTVIAGSDDDVEWFEYQVDEIDIFTIDKKHKLGYFHNEKAYCLSHPTAEMLNVLLRAGLLGEEDDEHQEFFEREASCRRPALVTESCLYSEEGNSRVRAFHVLNAQGLVDTIGIFYEERESEAKKDEKASGEGFMDTWEVLLGEWSGHAVTRRTGTYGSTFAEEEVKIIMRRGEHGNIVQEIESSYAGVNKKFSLEAAIIGKTLQFTRGLTSILLPNGIIMTFPVSVGKSVTQSQSFALEFCWITMPQTRRRIIRTYDMQGTVVSTTASNETRC